MTHHTSLSLLYKEIALVVVPLFAAFLSVMNLKLKASIRVAALGLLKLAAQNEGKKKPQENPKTKSHLNTLMYNQQIVHIHVKEQNYTEGK